MKNTLIIGWNSEALHLFDRIISYPALGYNIKGFISLNSHGQKLKYKNIPLLGTLDSVGSWVKLFQITDCLIAIRPEQNRLLDDIISKCRTIGIGYRIVGDVYDTVYGNVVRDIYHDLFRTRHFSLRRLLDKLFAIVLMLFFMPIFVCIAIAVKLESHGPLFYSQHYLGQDGRIFPLYKFRTMRQPDSKIDPHYLTAFDRTTRFGRILQQTRLDEIPQLLNIVKGDMAFVGPRPDKPFIFESLEQQIALYSRRLAVKPGVTGLAQINWPYDETISDVKEKLVYDLDYIERQNFWFDYKIILKSVSRLIAQE